ncbi:MAG: hypothetical protein OEZ43_17645 [Gammaproteobacteria bacterium]|nr:hypothetical protein [Gammaproteobacteria bacterium]
MNVPGFSLFSREDSNEPASLDERLMARLAHAFIAHTVADGDSASREVTDALLSMQKQMMKAKYELEKIVKVGSSVKTNKTIHDTVNKTLADISDAVVAMQFFDRISQRLEHTSNVIRLLYDIEYSVNFDDPAEVRRALVRIYNSLSMDDERELFRSVKDGDDLKKALRAAHKRLRTMLNSSGSIQLF